MLYQVEHYYMEYLFEIVHELYTNNKHLAERNISNQICIT